MNSLLRLVCRRLLVISLHAVLVWAVSGWFFRGIGLPDLSLKAAFSLVLLLETAGRILRGSIENANIE